MFIKELQLQHFRCFTEKTIVFDKKITVLVGHNGSGKTTILEALFFLVYGKSFRAHVACEVIESSAHAFFIKAYLHDQDMFSHTTLQLGYGAKKKIIKCNEKAVSSYKDILSILTVVALTAQDLDLIKGYPITRRSMIDHAVILFNKNHLGLYKNFKTIVAARNALLARGYDQSELDIWTEKLWQASESIAIARQKVAAEISLKMNEVLNQFFNGAFSVQLQYEQKYKAGSSQEFMATHYHRLSIHEKALKRSLFGAHLDDLIFIVNGRNARIFASAGQQKLVCLIVKSVISMIGQGLADQSGQAVLLIDDFISDFDQEKIDQFIDFLNHFPNQIIMTTPIFDEKFEKIIKKTDAGCIFIG